MTAPSQIDTTSLLTILGFIAAVWALISPASRLRLRFCMAWWDWMIGGIVFLIIHYLVFAPALERLGLYYSLGPWKWGLDSSSAVYLLLLSAVFYFFWRTRHPTLVRGRIGVFRELVENLQLTRRYDELVLLIDPQLPKLIRMTAQPPLIVRWIDHLQPSTYDIATLMSQEQAKKNPVWQQRLNERLRPLKARMLSRDDTDTHAHEVLLNLVTSPELTGHLAVAHPYFGLKLIEADEVVRADFSETYMDALLASPGSRLYVELKSNQNLNGGSRLALPKSNRMLYFFFADAAAAMKNGFDRAIGEAVCRRLDEDRQLVERLNEPLGYYFDVGRFHCPINSGITLFEIMVHEGIHQGLQDHMWLHYFDDFARKMLKQMPMRSDEDDHQEWPTPFHYLLYRLVSVACEWTEQCARVDDSEIPKATLECDGFDRHYISKQATIVLGQMLQDIIPSQKLSEQFKEYLLEIVVRCHITLVRELQLIDVADLLTTAVIKGSVLQTDIAYRSQLRDVFELIDHVRKDEAAQFKHALDEALS